MNWNPNETGPVAPGPVGTGPTVSLSISGQGVVGSGVQVGNATLHLNAFSQQPRGVQGSQGTFRPPIQMQIQQQHQQQQQSPSGPPLQQQPQQQQQQQGQGQPANQLGQDSSQQINRAGGGGTYEPTLLSLLSYPRRNPGGGGQVNGQVGQDPMMALRTMTSQQQGMMGEMMGGPPSAAQNQQQPGPGLNQLAMQQPRPNMMMNQPGGNPMMGQPMGVGPRGPQPGGPPQQNMMNVMGQQNKMRQQIPNQSSNAMVNQGPVQSPMSTSMANQMTPSPAGYAHSPSAGVVPSPVGVAASGTYLGRGQVGAPSPGSALNTPINSVSSPAGGPHGPGHGHQTAAGPPVVRSAEDQAYLDKLKQLSKYIEPLRRMIARIDKDEDRKKELSKMKSLADILSDPNRRCSMETLLKCEQVLERLDLKVRNVEQNMIGHVPSVTSMARLQNDNLWQPLLDAINANIKSPMFNHTLQRVFGPPITMLMGAAYSNSSTPSPPTKRRCVPVDDSAEIPDVLQGEIAHLDQRFKVQLDPVQHAGCKTVNLICQLDDKSLPCVPPISVTIPDNYPENPPRCNANKDQYSSTVFLKSVLNSLNIHLDKMPSQYSITSLLDTWEMCVRQTCSAGSN